MPDNEDGQLGVIFNKAVEYRGLSVTLYPTARPDGAFEIYDDVDEAGNPKSARVQALFDYADAFADEIERRTPAGSLMQNAINNGAVPVMGQQQPAQQQPQDVCDRCGGEARWTPYRTIKSGRDAGKSKRSLECANGCKNERGYAHTVRWQEGR